MGLQLDIYPQKFWAVAQLVPAVSACELQQSSPQRQLNMKICCQSRKDKNGFFLCYSFLRISCLGDHF